MAAVRGLHKEPFLVNEVDEGKNILRFRLFFFLKQRGLARLMRVSQSKVSRMENSKKVSEKNKLQVATAMGINKKFLEMTDEELKGVFIDSLIGAEGENNVVNIAAKQENNIHPIEKVSELYEKLGDKDREIYELKMQLLKEENERLKNS